jgi:hypothetical protein
MVIAFNSIHNVVLLLIIYLLCTLLVFELQCKCTTKFAKIYFLCGLAHVVIFADRGYGERYRKTTAGIYAFNLYVLAICCSVNTKKCLPLRPFFAHIWKYEYT